MLVFPKNVTKITWKCKNKIYLNFKNSEVLSTHSKFQQKDMKLKFQNVITFNIKKVVAFMKIEKKKCKKMLHDFPC